MVVNRGSKAQIWRNVTAGAGNWIALRLTQPAPNVDAIGAWVEVKHGAVVTQREITSGGGHVSGQLGWVHFGLGEAEAAQVRVIWPDGAVGEWETVKAGARVMVGRP